MQKEKAKGNNDQGSCLKKERKKKENTEEIKFNCYSSPFRDQLRQALANCLPFCAFALGHMHVTE